MATFPVNQRLSEEPIDIPGSFPFHIAIATIDSHYPPHRHDYLEISLVIAGNGSQIINGEHVSMSPGVCTLLLPYQIHELMAGSEPMVLYNCMFDPDFLLFGSHGKSGLWNLLFNSEELPAYVRTSGTVRDQLQQITRTMHEEFMARSQWGRDLIKNKLSEFLIYFDRLRRQEHVATDLDATPPNGSCHYSIWPIVHYVHTHYGDMITLSSVSELFGMHPSRLSSEFAKHVGMNFIPFLHEVRIRHACSLLISTNITITDIGIEAGFNSFKSFSRVFKQLKGATPREYRQRYQID